MHAGGRVLFRGLHFDLPSGSVLTLRGSNGSGKSTLLRTLAGLLPLRAGELRWCGQSMSPASADYQRQLAYLGHQPGMNDALTGLENLRFALTLTHSHPTAISAQAEDRMREVLRQLDLSRAAGLAFGRLSQGQRRRFGLARVLLSGKPLWLLDEPDNALDEQGLHWLAQTLGNHAAAGGMAVVATHRGLQLPFSPALDLSSFAQVRAGKDVALC
ncbi:heme ABC exporter ATP-binding protein CcmA [Diaphorobacter aerolatus]|uniref:Heme ABC exporter ATP-binding protein CcmA n=1 Tax=Diaphorobacter aerolatus TaxID=1288495 RepID=A0A7H0GKH4_9BURK|nr:heme ABC exporter ATP-binding protein CcmA [Diaphorobacter aerolatus]QNP48790.1 heme ABC exporter ATP-binding protein CcmA [Diaphorobacter aerolatus]